VKFYDTVMGKLVSVTDCWHSSLVLLDGMHSATDYINGIVETRTSVMRLCHIIRTSCRNSSAETRTTRQLSCGP